jgi:cyclopropane fatty-acyl-phospholipid synthase-like methyltransferase
MERIPEPDLMDDKAQAEAYAATDFSEPHDAFVSYFRNHFPYFDSGDVLDLGCGTADVIIRFARAFPNIQITGIDGAQAMLDIGINDIDAAGLSDIIVLKKYLLPDNDICARKYDALISNNLLHHLQNPLVLWDTVMKCTKKNTPVFIMDLYRPESPEEAEKIVELHAEGAPDLLKKDFYNSLLASYNINEIKQQIYQAGLNFLSVDIVSDRHIAIWGQSE